MNHESCASYLHLNTEKKSKFTIFFGAEYQVVFDRIEECKTYFSSPSNLLNIIREIKKKGHL